MEEEDEGPTTWMTTETRPIEPNDTWSKRAKIRPVEVVVTRNQSLHKLDLDLSTRRSTEGHLELLIFSERMIDARQVKPEDGGPDVHRETVCF